jgi:GTPase Era involved in 16S rRNA processing
MRNLINQCYEWSEIRGLNDLGYRPEVHASFIMNKLAEILQAGGDKVESATKLADVVIYALNALNEITEDPETTLEVLQAVADKNDCKGNKIDENGHLTKEDNFSLVAPQAEVAKLLGEAH